MDPRIVEAFFRSIVEGIKDSDLPMEPSDLMKDHISLYADPNFKLDFRCSSFKRVSNRLSLESINLSQLSV